MEALGQVFRCALRQQVHLWPATDQFLPKRFEVGKDWRPVGLDDEARKMCHQRLIGVDVFSSTSDASARLQIGISSACCAVMAELRDLTALKPSLSHLISGSHMDAIIFSKASPRWLPMHCINLAWENGRAAYSVQSSMEPKDRNTHYPH